MRVQWKVIGACTLAQTGAEVWWGGVSGLA